MGMVQTYGLNLVAHFDGIQATQPIYVLLVIDLEGQVELLVITYKVHGIFTIMVGVMMVQVQQLLNMQRLMLDNNI